MKTYGSRYQKKTIPVSVYAAVFLLSIAAGFFLSAVYGLSGADIGENSVIMYILAHPSVLIHKKTVAIVGISAMAGIFIISYLQYYYRNFQSKLEHGDEDWLSVEEANQELSDPDEKYNRIVSENLKISLRGQLSNNNMLVVGSSGCGKTTALMHPNLLQMTSSYVVLDVKGDTQRKLGKAMIRGGYTVKSLNFKNPAISDRWNPFVCIEKEEDMLRIIKALHDAARPQKEMSAADPFWDDAIDLYLEALFYYAWLDAREKGKTGSMNDILRLCTLESVSIKRKTGNVDEKGNEETEEVSKLQLLMEEKEQKYGENYPPNRSYFKLKDGAPDTVRSVILMINAMLSICETAEVRRIFSDNDINIREIGTGVDGDPKKPVILFLVIPDNNNVYNWIISMFYTQMFDILIRLSDDELHRPLPLPVEVWMDEFYAGARPAEPDVLLGVVRSRNISMIPILQSVSQIKTLYKEAKWEVIMDNTATVVFLGSGPAAESTHKFISDLLGEATADVRTDNMNRGSHGSNGLNFARGGVKLMTPGQVKRMPQTDCIVFLEARPPVYDRKAFPFDRPALGYAAKKEAKERYSAALALGAYDHPVRTIYDPVHFEYITIRTDKTLIMVDDEKEAEIYLSAAKRDKENLRLYKFDNLNELLYMSWGTPEKSREEVEKLYREALAAEKEYENKTGKLYVLNGVPASEILIKPDHAVDKSSWEITTNLNNMITKHWEELSEEEKEILCFALDADLPDEQIVHLMCQPKEKMIEWQEGYEIKVNNR